MIKLPKMKIVRMEDKLLPRLMVTWYKSSFYDSVAGPWKTYTEDEIRELFKEDEKCQ